jgi:ABC-type Fe3+ transport system permease subunit
MLVPAGVETLATQFWAFQDEGSYGAAAPYALVIIAVAVLPGMLLGLWFDRRPQPSWPEGPDHRESTRAPAPITVAAR